MIAAAAPAVAVDSPPVLFLSDAPSRGDAHWRLARPYVRLKAAGHEAALCWLGPDLLPTAPVAGRVVVLQRLIVDDGDDTASRRWVDRLRGLGAAAVVFDLDDDELSGCHIEHLDKTTALSTRDRAALERQRRGLLATLVACDGATVSTEALAAVARGYTDRPVAVVPNAIDVDWFERRLADPPPWPGTTIGWAGWRRPDEDLAPMAAAWERIAARYPEVRFVVAGHQPDAIYRRDIPLGRIVRVPIRPIDEYPPLHQVTIGCCSVSESPFSRCKTPIKAYEYALAGAAVVGTPFLYGDELAHGGLMARSADDWERALGFLLDYPGARAQTAAQLRGHVVRNHALDGALATHLDAYRRIADAAKEAR